MGNTIVIDKLRIRLYSDVFQILYIPVQVIQNGDQEVLVELKGIGELLCHLPDTVYELKEDGSSLIVTVVLVTMTDTLHSREKIEILFRNWKHSTMQVLKLIYLLELVAK